MTRTASRRSLALPPPRDPALVRALLAVCDALRFVYTALGVEYPAFRALLRTKLVLDHRRPRAGAGRLGLAGNASFVAMLGIYLLFSIFLGMAARVVEGPFWYATLVQSATMAMVALPLLADFSSVLLDTSDLAVLGALPIADRTLLAVRLTHVALYVGLLLAAIAVGPLVVGATRYAPLVYVPLFVASSALAGLLATCGLVLVYLVALRSLPPARLRDWMVNAQAALFLAFFLGTQLAGQLFVWIDLESWIERRPALLALFPPASFGGLMRLGLGEAQPLDRWLALEAFALPLASLGLVALLARRGYLSALAAMAGAAGDAPRERRRYGLAGRASARVLRDPLGRAGADFFFALSASDRGFRLRALPQMGALVVPLVLLVLRPERGQLGLGAIGERLPLALGFAPYVFLFLALAMWEHARFSEWWQGRWSFDELDRGERDRFVRGSLSAIVLRFVAIPSALSCLVAAIAVGPRALASALHAAALATAGALLLLPLLARYLPFAEEHSPSRAQSSVGLSMLTFGFVGVLGLAHWAVGLAPFGHEVAAVVSLGLLALALRRFPRARLRLRAL